MNYITHPQMSLVMALNERCPNYWHMLIERLILLYHGILYIILFIELYSIKKFFFYMIIKSGEQVSIRLLTYLKVKERSFILIKRTLCSGFIFLYNCGLKPRPEFWFNPARTRIENPIVLRSQAFTQNPENCPL